MAGIALTRGERFREARAQLPKGENSMKAVEKATGVSTPKICALEDDSSDREVGYQSIVKLADHYNVSVAWLLGCAEDSTKNEELGKICDYTGLSSRAVETLHSLLIGPEYSIALEFINEFLSDPDMMIFEMTSRWAVLSDILSRRSRNANKINWDDLSDSEECALLNKQHKEYWAHIYETDRKIWDEIVNGGVPEKVSISRSLLIDIYERNAFSYIRDKFNSSKESCEFAWSEKYK